MRNVLGNPWRLHGLSWFWLLVKRSWRIGVAFLLFVLSGVSLCRGGFSQLWSACSQNPNLRQLAFSCVIETYSSLPKWNFGNCTSNSQTSEARKYYRGTAILGAFLLSFCSLTLFCLWLSGFGNWRRCFHGEKFLCICNSLLSVNGSYLSGKIQCWGSLTEEQAQRRLCPREK